MIIALERCNPPFVLHLRGQLDTPDFLRLANLLAAQQASRKCSRLLFDWSELTSWNFTMASLSKNMDWLTCAGGIDRVAIVHHRRWNRQAAWVAAVLRTKNRLVRSFRFDERERAVAWLNVELAVK
jgi:hypothetical protein